MLLITINNAVTINNFLLLLKQNNLPYIDFTQSNEEIQDAYYELINPNSYGIIETRYMDKNKKIERIFPDSKEHFKLLCKVFNRYRNCFINIHPRCKRDGHNDAVKAILCLVLDADVRRLKGHTATNEQLILTLYDVTKACYDLRLEFPDLHPIIIFSGNGFHIYLPLEIIELNDENRQIIKNKLKSSLRYLSQKYSTNNTQFDNLSDLARIIRIPTSKNNKHPELDRYCYPLTPLDRKPSKLLKEFVLNFKNEEKQNKAPHSRVNDLPIRKDYEERACNTVVVKRRDMNRLIYQIGRGFVKNMSHKQRILLCRYLIREGWSDEAISILFGNFADYDRVVTLYQVGYIRKKYSSLVIREDILLPIVADVLNTWLKSGYIFTCGALAEEVNRRDSNLRENAWSIRWYIKRWLPNVKTKRRRVRVNGRSIVIRAVICVTLVGYACSGFVILKSVVALCDGGVNVCEIDKG